MIRRWLVRRRIAISLIGFTTLMLINVLVRRTLPHNPLAVTEPVVALSGCLLLLGLAIRSWSAGTLNKSRELTTSGPYALIRNPLYLGSFMMMFGFCLLCRDLPNLLFVLGPISGLYWMQIRFEEERLAGLFPDQWPQYARRVPRMIPNHRSRLCFRGWSTYEWLRNREYKALLATLVGVLAILGWYLAYHWLASWPMFAAA